MSGNCCRAHSSPSNAQHWRDQICLSCKKPSHFADACRSKSQTQLSYSVKQARSQASTCLSFRNAPGCWKEHASFKKPAHDTGVQGNKLPMSFYRQILAEPRWSWSQTWFFLASSITLTAYDGSQIKNHATTILYLVSYKGESTLFCRTVSWSSHFVITLAHSVINLKWMVEGQVNPIISIIIDNNNNNNNNESNDNSNCLLLLLLRIFYDNNKNLY